MNIFIQSINFNGETTTFLIVSVILLTLIIKKR